MQANIASNAMRNFQDGKSVSYPNDPRKTVGGNIRPLS